MTFQTFEEVDNTVNVVWSGVSNVLLFDRNFNFKKNTQNSLTRERINA